MPTVTRGSLRDHPGVTVEEGHRAASWEEKPINVPALLCHSGDSSSSWAPGHPTNPLLGTGPLARPPVSPARQAEGLRSCSTEQRAASPSPRGGSEPFVGFKRYLRRRQQASDLSAGLSLLNWQERSFRKRFKISDGQHSEDS